MNISDSRVEVEIIEVSYNFEKMAKKLKKMRYYQMILLDLQEGSANKKLLKYFGESFMENSNKVDKYQGIIVLVLLMIVIILL